jgi:hypothetical protein
MRIWRARNIRGVILNNVRAAPPLDLPWENFAWVMASHITGIPDFHRVGIAIYEVVKRGLLESINCGYRRPALAVRLTGANREGFRWPGAFIGNLLRFGLEPDLHRIYTGDWNFEEFRKWFRKTRPDVLFALADQPKHWLQSMAVDIPGQVGFVHLAANLSNDQVSGVAQDFHRVGEAAVHALDSALRRNELGIPRTPASFTVTGAWREGNTLRQT